MLVQQIVLASLLKASIYSFTFYFPNTKAMEPIKVVPKVINEILMQSMHLWINTKVLTEWMVSGSGRHKIT